MNTHWLNVPQEEADKAKALRCKWDADKRRWWKPSNVSIRAVPKHWLPPEALVSNATKRRRGLKAAAKANSKGLWDTKSNIAYPSITCVQKELNLTYRQVKDLIASRQFKQIPQ